MMTDALGAEQREAIAAPFEESLAILGPNRSGKTTALRERAARFARERGDSAFYASHPAQLLTLACAVLTDAGEPVGVVDEIVSRRLFDRLAQPLFDLRWDELERRDIDPEVAALRSPERFADAAYRLLRKLRDAAIDPATFRVRSRAPRRFTPARRISHIPICCSRPKTRTAIRSPSRRKNCGGNTSARSTSPSCSARFSSASSPRRRRAANAVRATP
jgi:hypothetical protein